MQQTAGLYVKAVLQLSRCWPGRETVERFVESAVRVYGQKLGKLSSSPSLDSARQGGSATLVVKPYPSDVGVSSYKLFTGRSAIF